jgi:hypothetical protein
MAIPHKTRAFPNLAAAVNLPSVATPAANGAATPPARRRRRGTP